MSKSTNCPCQRAGTAFGLSFAAACILSASGCSQRPRPEPVVPPQAPADPIHREIRHLRQANSQSERDAAVKALASLGKPAVTVLMEEIFQKHQWRDGTVAPNQSNRDIRIAAVRTLAAIGPEAIRGLVWAFEDDDRLVRAEAVKSLAGIGTPAIPALIDLLNIAKPGDREGVKAALAALGKPAASALADRYQELEHEPYNGDYAIVVGTCLVALHKGDLPALERLAREPSRSEVRVAAIKALADIGKPAVPVLAALWGQDPNNDEHRAAADGLRAIGNDAVTILMAALNDPGADQRAAASGLRAFGANAKSAVPLLVPKLRDDEVKGEAAAALRDIGPPKDAIPDLILLLTSRARSLGSDTYPLGADQKAAAEALGKIGKDAVVPVFRVFKASPKQRGSKDPILLASNRMWAAHTFRLIGRDALALLVGALKDSDHGTPLAAAEALGIMGKNASAAIPAVRNALKPDAYNRVNGCLDRERVELSRAEAARALGRIGAKEAIPELKAALTEAEYLIGEFSGAVSSSGEPLVVGESPRVVRRGVEEGGLVWVGRLRKAAAAEPLRQIDPKAFAALPIEKGERRSRRVGHEDALGN